MGCPNYGALYMVGSRSSGWVQRNNDSANVETPLSGNTYALIAVPIRQDFGAGCELYKNKYRANYQDIVSRFLTLEEAGDQFGVFRLDTR